MPVADFECVSCGRVRELELPQPESVELRCCVPEDDRDCYEYTVHRRVWGAVSIGAVRGAGGSPGRYGAGTPRGESGQADLGPVLFFGFACEAFGFLIGWWLHG